MGSTWQGAPCGPSSLRASSQGELLGSVWGAPIFPPQPVRPQGPVGHPGPLPSPCWACPSGELMRTWAQAAVSHRQSPFGFSGGFVVAVGGGS